MRLGPALTAGASAGLILVLADRILGPGLPWGVLLGLPVAAAVVAAVVTVLARRSTPLSTAAELDASLGLKDRISTAMSIEAEGADDDPFRRAALEDAERAAEQIDPRAAIRYRLDSSWWTAWPVIGAAAVLAAVLMPAWHLLTSDPEAEQRRVMEVADRDRAREEITRTAEAVRETLEIDQIDELSPRELETLRQIEQELTEGRISPEEARREAARALEEISSGLEREAERRRAEEDAFKRLLAEAAARQREDEPALTRALREGDTRTAREELEQLRQRLEEMSDEQRRDLAEAMEQLASELEDLARGHAPDEREEHEQPDPAETPDRAPDEAEERAREMLRDHGFDDEQMDDLLDDTDRDSLRDKLEDEGLDEEQADRLADRLASENRQREAEQRARERAEELSRSMREASEQLREGEPGREQEETERTEEGEDPADPAADDARPDGADRPGDEQREATETGTEVVREEAEAEGERPDAEPDPEEQAERRGEEDPDAMERLRQQFEEFERGEEMPDRGQRSAEQLRQQARELLDGADRDSPDPQETARPMPGQRTEDEHPGGVRPGDDPFEGAPEPRARDPITGREDTVDLRRPLDDDDSPGRILSEWLSSRDREGEPGVASRGDVERALGRAAESAERAIEDRAVPTRYDSLMRRYFRRLPDRVLPADQPVRRAPDAGG